MKTLAIPVVLLLLTGCEPNVRGAYTVHTSYLPSTPIHGDLTAGRSWPWDPLIYRVSLPMPREERLAGGLREGMLTFIRSDRWSPGTYSVTGGLPPDHPDPTTVDTERYFPALSVQPSIDSGTVTIRQERDSVFGAFTLYCTTCGSSKDRQPIFEGTFAYPLK